MNEKYVPNGTPLTDAEDELLEVLIEECAEVIQAATKLKRFGRENNPGNGVLNTRKLSLEFGDVLAVAVVISASANPMLIDDAVRDGARAKVLRLKKYLQHAVVPDHVEDMFSDGA